MVSGRRPEVFNAVAALVREARAHPNMRLLVACRTFDLENDQRLRDLREQEKTRAISITISQLDPERVKEVVTHLGLSPDRLDTNQIELLRLPLHLALLAGVIRGEPGRPVDFASVKDLHDAFWRRKRTDLLPVLSDQNAFETLLHDLCGAMNDRQTLSVPRGLLPPGDADLDRLVSAHVLVRQGSRIGFFHESFFDYVFARRFCETGESLLELLHSAEQDLFRRSQVRQILAYRRDDDFGAYLDDLRDCLVAADVRFHMKKLMIGVVGQVPDPRPEEWAILEDHLQERTGKPSDPVRDALWLSAPWFRILHDQGVVTNWLADDRAETKTFAFNWLAQMANVEPDKVSVLLEGLAGLSQEQDERVLAVITWHDVAASSERIETLFHRLATGAGRDWTFSCNAYQAFFKNYCYGRSRDVRVACRALGRWLRLLAEEDSRAELFAHNRETQRVIDEHQLANLAKKAPAALADATMAPFLDLLERAAIREADPPFEDRIWHQGFRELTLWPPEALLVSLVDALRQIATSSHDLFRSSLDHLRASPCRTAHAVLLRALIAEGGTWKPFAIDYLAETWTRWGLWYGDQARWDCRCLLQTLAPQLDEGDVARLEPCLLTHYERWPPLSADKLAEGKDYIREQARRFRWRLGQEQYELLGALPPNKLSQAGRRCFGELFRKASSLGWPLDEPFATRGGTVISPLPEQATSRMTDTQWLSAIQEYADDKERVWLEDRILGGARELARVLEKKTKAQPERFARLMLAFPDDANEHYFRAVMMGLNGGGLPLDLLGQVIERAHNRPDHPHGRWIPPTIASHGDKGLPTTLLDVIAWYATEDPDPDEELWQKDAGRNGPYYSGDPHEHGINSVRGSAARAIAELISRDQSYWEHFAPVLERMVADPSIAVRTCVVEVCIQSLRYDRPGAIAHFLWLCEADDDLLTTPLIERFLYYTAHTELEQVRPVLERMLASPIANARQGAARQVTLAALSEEAARSLADTMMNGDPVTRKGAAEVLSRNILTTPDRAYCAVHLIRLFDDPDKEVQRAAGSWPRHIREEGRIGPVLLVAEAFVETPAFAENAKDFFWAIEEAVDAPPSLLLRAGHRFVEIAGSAAGDTSWFSASTAQSLSNLILRAYRQAEQDPDLRRQCLDLFDHLLEVGGYRAEDAIEAFGR